MQFALGSLYPISYMCCAKVFETLTYQEIASLTLFAFLTKRVHVRLQFSNSQLIWQIIESILGMFAQINLFSHINCKYYNQMPECIHFLKIL